eukprot:TRINITY_DN1308_c0_g1_i1.p1 TRINITY_DN1308_c0_g1~~TRINITY_DN1308_c0_g1_i1.p1  ORF type:complete len:482 (-),score=112.50 TRINITY_DN1308_c0_g1_i1:940-2355(-)
MALVITAPDLSDVLDLALSVAKAAREAFKGKKELQENLKNFLEILEYVEHDLKVVDEKFKSPEFLRSDSVNAVTRAAELLRTELKQCKAFLATKNSSMRSKIPKNGLRTVKRLTSSLTAADGLLVNTINAFGITLPETRRTNTIEVVSPLSSPLAKRIKEDDEKSIPPLSPTVSSSSNNDDSNDEVLEDLTEAMHLLLCLERVVNPVIQTHINRYREKLVDLKKAAVVLGIGCGRTDAVLASIQLTELRCFIRSDATQKGIEKAFWKTAVGEQKHHTAALKTLMEASCSLSKLEPVLIQHFVETREIIENLKTFKIPASEAIFLNGIIASYMALHQLVDPLTALGELRDKSKKLIKTIDEAKIEDAQSQKMVEFKPQLDEIVKNVRNEQMKINKSALRKANELIDSIQFCSHLFTAAYGINFVVRRAHTFGAYSPSAPTSPRGTVTRLTTKLDLVKREAEELAGMLQQTKA